MALSILDGNQSATTLSTILSSGQHITAHTVVSLGTQAITDMRGAVSGSVVSISNFPASQVISGTVTANPTGTQTIAGAVTANVPLSVDGYTATTGVRVIGTGVDGGLRIQGIDPNTGFNPANLEEGGGIPIFPLNNNPLPISGTVSLGIQQSDDTDPNIKFLPIGFAQSDGGGQLDYWAGVKQTNPLPVYLPSTYSLPAGTNRIGVVTIGGGTVTIGAGTAQIGSVTVGNSVTIGSLPAIAGTVTANVNSFPDATTIGEQIAQGFTNYGSFEVSIGGTANVAGSVTIGAGTAQIGSVTASISNSVTIASFATSVTARLINPAGTAVTYAEVGTAGSPSIDVLSIQGVTSGTPLTILNHQGTTVTTSNFTSTTASTVLASANTSREVLTIFNEGAGNLHICAGATCTTIAYQVRLSAGGYYEVPLNQTSLTHSAVFATAGTARVVQIS
jgi:hypothetical protein